MTGTLAEILGLALVLATQGLLLLIAWDARDDFASMDRRLERRDARRAARAARAASAARPGRAVPQDEPAPPRRVGAR